MLTLAKIAELWTLLRTVVVGLWEHRSAIAALLLLLHNRKKEGDRELGTDLERGFRVLSEARSPTALYNAVASRCGDDGCLLPYPGDGGRDP